MSGDLEPGPLAGALADRAKQAAARQPQHRREVMEASHLRLVEAAVAARALACGDVAPEFELADHRGIAHRLTEMVERGPLVISFYRGQWCPYCNLELRALQGSVPLLRMAGADLVAISPNTPDGALTVAERNELSFPVLSDLGNHVARRFGLTVDIDAALQAVYEEMGIDVGTDNGDGAWEIPIPATYVVDRGGVIRYAFVDVDYRLRAEPSDVVDVVRGLSP